MTKSQDIIILDHLVNDKATAADVTWLFKVTESDMSLRDCDGYLLLSKRMFADSRLCEKFTLGHQKTPYVIQEGLYSLLEVKIVESVPYSPAAFTLMVDKTTTKQQRRKMDAM